VVRSRIGGRSRAVAVVGLVVAAVVVLYLTTGRAGLAEDGPVLRHERGWGLGSSYGMAAVVGGALSYEDGCLLLSGNAVIWPDGTGWDEGAGVVTLPDGLVATPGTDTVTGGGGMALEPGERGEGQEDSPGARATEDCRGPGDSLVVFNSDAALEVRAR
jgi:hypothetical protein